MDPQISIVLALYNGADFINAQVQSCLEQTTPPTQIVISDDGSKDAGPDLLRGLEKTTPHIDWVWRQGPRQGFAANFLCGLDGVGDAITHVALSDQDDVWEPEKLSRAMTLLKGVDGPAIVCGRTWICDQDLSNPRPSRPLVRPAEFANALVQNIAAGNTIVMNRPALDIVRQATPRIGSIVAHDWWIYQLITGAGGHVIWDDTPGVYYRQHGGNLIGSNTGIGATLARMGQMLVGRYRQWNDQNITALQSVHDLLTPKARDQIQKFQVARAAPFHKRLSALKASGVWRQSARGQMSLQAAALLGRI